MRLDQEEIEDFSYYNDTSLQYVAIGENVKKIGEKAFAKAKYLTAVKIEEGSTPIRICLDAFNGCKDLVEIASKREVVFYKKIKYRRKSYE